MKFGTTGTYNKDDYFWGVPTDRDYLNPSPKPSFTGPLSRYLLFHFGQGMPWINVGGRSTDHNAGLSIRCIQD